MTGKVSMDFCDACRLYRLCISETSTWPQGSESGRYCIEHRSDYRHWNYAITLHHNKLVVVASGNNQTTVKGHPATLEQARTMARRLARPGEQIIKMLPDGYCEPPPHGDNPPD